MPTNILSPVQSNEFLNLLKDRFEKNLHRHVGLKWADIQSKLVANPQKLWSLNQMEQTGGEPDVVKFNSQKSEYDFYDCSPETPVGRRNLCYDQASREARKEHRPKNSACEQAVAMGIELLTEDQYRHLQKLDVFDTKTSSWLNTPPEIRALGGAIFADRRYATVFTYHNSAESYYSSRGFRASLRI